MELSLAVLGQTEVVYDYGGGQLYNLSPPRREHKQDRTRTHLTTTQSARVMLLNEDGIKKRASQGKTCSDDYYSVLSPPSRCKMF